MSGHPKMEGDRTWGDEDDLADDVFLAPATLPSPEARENPCPRLLPPPMPSTRKMSVVQGPATAQAPGSQFYRGEIGTGDGPSILLQLCPTHPCAGSPRGPSWGSGGAGSMVTLQSLGRDSGYVPSPSSANSFTFSSDDDEEVDQSHGRRPGVTPPINIPQARARPPPPRRALSPPRRAPERKTATGRRRARSCSEIERSRAPPRPPLPRYPPYLTPQPSHLGPAHARNWSTPATHADGQPLLRATPEDCSDPRNGRTSRDVLVDLAEDDAGNGGHRRRVLVLTLPDVVVDAQDRASGPCTPPSALPPARPYRPAWRRPRALSCDVTLLEEMGRELRMMADVLQHSWRRELDEEGLEASLLHRVWRSVRGSFDAS